METVLISGGSGLVGAHLTQMLLSEGYAVRHLGRSARTDASVPTFVWDLKNHKVDLAAFDGVDHIVHLAGASIADKPWSEKRKKILIESRVDTARLLYEGWQQSGQSIKSFISASAIGYYGMVISDQIFVEDDPPSKQFISSICALWEESGRSFERAGVRTCFIRIGLVLAKEGGALPTMSKPVKFGLGAALGSGKQHMAWIHIRDLCRLFMQAIKDEGWSGPYNGVAPNAVTNKAFTKLMAKVLNMPLWLPNVPGIALKLFLGEMSQIVLAGPNVSAAKVQATGFKYEFTEPEPALRNLLQP